MFDFLDRNPDANAISKDKRNINHIMHIDKNDIPFVEKSKPKDILSFLIRVIPHTAQRYETVGDYYRDEDENMHIKVSHMSDNRHELLVIIHELIEVILTEHRGISEKSISDFDIEFEKNRQPNNLDEPGDDIHAPYYKEHQIATAVERLMAAELNVDWHKYENECNSL
jgi:hypothetical protein